MADDGAPDGERDPRDDESTVGADGPSDDADQNREHDAPDDEERDGNQDAADESDSADEPDAVDEPNAADGDPDEPDVADGDQVEPDVTSGDEGAALGDHGDAPADEPATDEGGDGGDGPDDSAVTGGEGEFGAPPDDAADFEPDPDPDTESGVDFEEWPGYDAGEAAPGADAEDDSAASDLPQEDAPLAYTDDPSGEAASDGGVYPNDGVSQDAPVADDDWPVHEGAPDDEEMPLADHIEEMVRRVGVVVVVMAAVSGVVFPFGDQLINFLWYSILPGTDVSQPRVYHPLALILARLKVATLAGFIIALPVFVYETYLFMRPGLYPHERRYYLASVPTSLVLATVGVLFAYLLVLPAIFTYFLYYSEDVAVIAFGLTETFDLMVLLLGFFALIFQIPLFVMLAIMMGLTSRRWLAARRLYFWGAFLGIAFLFSPDPTGMAPIIVAATMVALFEGTLLVLKWTRRG